MPLHSLHTQQLFLVVMRVMEIVGGRQNGDHHRAPTDRDGCDINAFGINHIDYTALDQSSQ